MFSYESPQREMANNGKNQQSYRDGDTEIWARNAHGDRTFFTSDFDVSCTTVARTLCASRRRDPSKRSKRLFTAWIVKLNNENRLIVEGSLECGRRARTKPIAERLSASTILSKFKHMYHLVGNMVDPQHELPGFVRHRFQAGFPEDWEIVVGIWKSFVTSVPNGEKIRSSCMSGDFIVEKKLKLAVDGCADECFVECARKVDMVDSKTHPEFTDIVNENIENMEYYKNSKQSRAAMSQSITKSFVDYESQDDPRSGAINDIKQLIGWTPFAVPDKDIEYSLVFRGTLLSSMGHPVSKNHVTNAVHRRLSARIIETVNQERYELIGNINNTKRDVPKELVMWCRYGCPKQIHLFCEKLRILRNEETKFRKPSPRGEMKMSQDERESPEICHTKSANFIGSGRTKPMLIIQPGREKKKRKRIPMELNEACYTGDSSVDSDTTNNEKSCAILNNSRDRRWSKIRRNSKTNLPDNPRRSDDGTSQCEDLKIFEEVRPFITHENKLPSSPLKQAGKQVPSLSYVYHRSAPSTECILSDGV